MSSNESNCTAIQFSSKWIQATVQLAPWPQVPWSVHQLDLVLAWCKDHAAWPGGAAHRSAPILEPWCWKLWFHDITSCVIVIVHDLPWWCHAMICHDVMFWAIVVARKSTNHQNQLQLMPDHEPSTRTIDPSAPLRQDEEKQRWPRQQPQQSLAGDFLAHETIPKFKQYFSLTNLSTLLNLSQKSAPGVVKRNTLAKCTKVVCIWPCEWR